MKTILFFLWIGIAISWGKNFAPAAGQPGTTAIANENPSILRWADEAVLYEPGADAGNSFRDPEQALGPAEGNPFQVTSLGLNGELILSFSTPFENGEGPEFAVFENSFSRTFLELAFVEVSSDGENFFRFENESCSPSTATSAVLASDIDGLAGKYAGGFGTPFDLQDLPASPLLDKEQVRFVRLLDIVSGEETDSTGDTIYDVVFAGENGGFECDGIAALSTREFVIPLINFQPMGQDFLLSWISRVGGSYRVEATSDLSSENWESLGKITATTTTSSFLISENEERLFLRIVRE